MSYSPENLTRHATRSKCVPECSWKNSNIINPTPISIRSSNSYINLQTVNNINHAPSQMHPQHLTHHRILAVDPYHRGIGFAVLEGHTNLVDWGLRTTFQSKISSTLRHVDTLIEQYQPTVLVLPDCPSRRSARCKRLQRLLWEMVSLASLKKLEVYRYTRQRVKQTFSESGVTKYDIALALAGRFTELTPRLPPVRKPWMSEVDRMNIFDAIALACTYFDAIGRNDLQEQPTRL